MMRIQQGVQSARQMNIKLHGTAMERMYLKGRGTKPQHQFSVCAKCGHPLVDEPPFNKDYYWENKTLEGEWLNMHSHMQEYLVTKCNPLLDKKGAIITALKIPTYHEEVLICHYWHNFQSPIAGGTVCALKCYDSKSKNIILQASARLVFALALLSAQRSEFIADVYFYFLNITTHNALLSF